MTFGERLKIARKNCGYTQEQLAKMVGVAKSTLTGYEIGNREPYIEIIKKLAVALNITADELLGISITTKAVQSTEANAVAHAFDKASEPVQKTVLVALEPYMDA